MARSTDPVYRITAAGTSMTDDQRGRMVRYSWSMGIRVICFFGAIVSSGVVRWVLVLGAVVLPYVAVVFANAGRDVDRDKPLLTVFQRNRQEIDGQAAPGSENSQESPDPLH